MIQKHIEISMNGILSQRWKSHEDKERYSENLSFFIDGEEIILYDLLDFLNGRNVKIIIETIED